MVTGNILGFYSSTDYIFLFPDKIKSMLFFSDVNGDASQARANELMSKL